MANEFIARKGIISSGSVYVSGSLTANNYISSSVFSSSIANGVGYFGTSSWAISSSWSPPQQVVIKSNTFDGDGVTSIFTLTEPFDIDSIIVSVDGLTYTKTEDYSVSSVNLIFVSAPPTQSNILVRAFVNVTNNAVGSFSGSFLGSITSASYAQTSSFTTRVAVYTGSLVDGQVSYSGSFTGSLLGTASVAISASYAVNATAVIITSSAPPTPVRSQLWLDDTTGKTYIWYNSGSTYQWVLQSDPTYDIGAVVEAASASIAFAIPTTSSASPVTGSIYFSGSFLYVYNGTKYVSASLN